MQLELTSSLPCRGPWTNIRRAVGALFAVALISTTGCFPIVVSEACRQQMDACLARCEPSDPSLSPDVSPSSAQATPLNDDYRSTCVRNCHDLCT